MDLLRFNRCAFLTALDLEVIEAQEDVQSALVHPDQARCRRADGEANKVGAGAREALGYASSDPRCLRPEVNAGMRFPLRPLSTENELAALTGVMIQLMEARDIFPTTLESDEVRSIFFLVWDCDVSNFSSNRLSIANIEPQVGMNMREMGAGGR